jgi:predicted site-specific integrase-resolvase
VSKGADLTPLARAATEFGVSTMTLYRWIAAGKLTRYERPGGRPRVFVDRREIRKLLEPKAVRRKR